MKQLKSVEKFSDIKCENCVSYNQCRCFHTLPAIPTESDNKCGDGSWLFDGKIINFHHSCFELLPFGFVTDVEELLCKNCGYYDLAGEECHYQRLNTYKSAPNAWCNNGVWLSQEKDNEVVLGSVYHLYETLIAGKDAEKTSSTKRQVKSVESLVDAICENCISYNQCRCCFTLPSVPVSSDNNCNEGQWLHHGKLLNLHGISNSLVSCSLVKDIKDLRCGECVFYNPSKQECHYHGQNVYKSGPDDWCENGEWLYEDNIVGTITGSLDFLYPKLMEGKDTEGNN